MMTTMTMTMTTMTMTAKIQTMLPVIMKKTQMVLKKASGFDKISHKMLKIAPEKIAEPLQIIFNKSLRRGKYPSSWKIAHVIAIFKKR
jgi:predicted anti-sigma-YlaC factor YlaD